jgi:hypothetical protein
MNIRVMAKSAEKMIVDNSPAILTAIGVTGTITTAYLAGQASFRAAKLIHDRYETDRFGEHIPDRSDLRDKFELTWRLYVPAVGVGASTAVCIVGAHRIGSRRAAAVAAAYTISEKAFTEYKEKVIEKFGEKQEREARDELQQERVDRDPVSGRAVIVTNDGDVLCYEHFAGRYFESSMEALKKAQNDTNYQIINHNYASLTDFYGRLGLPHTGVSDEVGWNSNDLLELEFSTTLSEDSRPCIAIDYNVAPFRNYHKVNG